MTRTYELALVIEPRQKDDEVAEIVAKYREMVEAIGGTITQEDDWGKRKLAYPIRKLNEGRYVFFYISSEVGLQWSDVERNLMQNEKILRYLVVRTDLDLKRAETKGKKRKESKDAAEPEESAA